MTWQLAMQAIRQAVATAAGLALEAVEWQHTGRDGLWTGYPRIKLIPVGNQTRGIPQERYTYDPVAAIMRRAVWSLDTFRVQLRIESDSTSLGDGAPFAPADRIGKVIRTPDVSAALEAANVSLHTLKEFGPFAVTAENRELSVSVAEALFQVNIPVDTTPEGGVGWFNIVQVHYDEGIENVPDLTIYGPSIEALLIPGAGLRIYRPPTPFTGSGAWMTTPLVVPAALPLVQGHRYRINGVILARTNTGNPIAGIGIHDLIIRRDAGTWTEVRAADVARVTYAGWEGIYLTAGDLPMLGYTGLTLELWHRPVLGIGVIAEFHGTIADIGPA